MASEGSVPAAAAAASQSAAGGEEEPEKITLNKREMRLGLRHRDSFAVHKSHMHQASGAGGAVNKEAAIAAAIAKQAGASVPAATSTAAKQSSVASVLLQAGAGSARTAAPTESSESAADVESPRGDEEDDEGEAALEGGPDEDGAVSLNPDSEAEILAALESLAGNKHGSAAAMMAAAADTIDGTTHVRKKNKLKSMVKGVASALGLRKSRKRREEEAARAAALAAAAGGGGAAAQLAAAGGAPHALLSPSARPMHRSLSSPAMVGEHDHLAGATADDLAALSSGKAIARPLQTDVLAAVASPRRSMPSGGSGSSSMPLVLLATSWEEHEPARDEAGSFLPCHRKEVRVPSILKGSNMSRKALAAVAAAAMTRQSGGSGDFTIGTPNSFGSTAPSPQVGASMPGFSLGQPAVGAAGGSAGASTPGLDSGPGHSARRGIVFADQTGKSLAHVHFSEFLHYGEHSEHEEWDEEEEGGGKCAIM